MKRYNLFNERMEWVGHTNANSAEEAIYIGKIMYNLAAPAVSLQLH